MADESPFTLEGRILASTWAHERKKTNDIIMSHSTFCLS